MRNQNCKKLYLELFTTKLNNLTTAEKERMNSVTEIAIQLMKQYGLEQMKFKFFLHPRYIGICHKDRIEFDLHYALRAPPHDIRNVILHEIAHALVGPGHGHREHWQNKARELGVTWLKRYHK